LQIEVRLPNGQCVKGVLQCCCLEYNIAVIKITGFSDLCAIKLERRRQFKSGSKVVAIGRIFDHGELTATHGMITDKLSKLDCEVLMVSTCKITKVHC
jgi:S1-C subfamily serine protease